MSTNRTLAVALAITAAVAVGAVGFIAGSRFGTAPTASSIDVDALVRQAIASRIKATPVQRIEVQDIIKNYLIANPDIVRDAMNALQVRDDAAAKAAQAMAIADNSQLI